MYTPPRFVLVLSVSSNLIRAALVTRDLKIVAAAQQTFSTSEGTFDPAEVWYKTKKVVAACLDIGRTLSREIVGLAIVSDEAQKVEWHEQDGEVVAVGSVPENRVRILEQTSSGKMTSYSGTAGDWLLWNLTGAYSSAEFGKTRARAPFDAELPVLAVLSEKDALKVMPDGEAPDKDRAVRGAAQSGWERV